MGKRGPATWPCQTPATTCLLLAWHHISFSLPPPLGSSLALWGAIWVHGGGVNGAGPFPPSWTFADNRKQGRSGEMEKEGKLRDLYSPSGPLISRSWAFNCCWEAKAGQEAEGLREWMLLPCRVPQSQPLRTPGSKMKGIVQPQILRVGRTHMSSALSSLPDTPMHRAQALLQPLLDSCLPISMNREFTTSSLQPLPLWDGPG